MTHNLVVNYGLYRKMDVFRPKLVSASQLTRFHSDDYINFLRVINPGKQLTEVGWNCNDLSFTVLTFTFLSDNMSEYVRQLQRFNVGDDCPVFDGLFEFCQLYASGSIGKCRVRFLLGHVRRYFNMSSQLSAYYLYMFMFSPPCLSTKALSRVKLHIISHLCYTSNFNLNGISFRSSNTHIEDLVSGRLCFWVRHYVVYLLTILSIYICVPNFINL